MDTSLPTKGKAFPPPGGLSALDRLAAFRITYVAVLAFVLLYVFSVKAAEIALRNRFQAAVSRAAEVDWREGSVVEQIRQRVGGLVSRSLWVRPGGVQVTAIVLGNDGSPIYVGALTAGGPEALDPNERAAEAQRVLPASVDVTVSVPHNSLVANAILVGYAAILLTGLYSYQRALASRQAALLEEAVQARDSAAGRAAEIERELDGVRQRLAETGAAGSEQAREIAALRGERAALREKLEALEQRERELLGQQTAGVDELHSEHQALEELLEEALSDLQEKDHEIQRLESTLKRASKDAAAAATARAREEDRLGLRLRTLYKNLEIDERAISDLVALRDETMKLKAEEALKRLSDDVETAGSRRKVGGLPPGVPIFELGYAGKGRIYYTHGGQRRLRVLCIGAKNSQNADLEYLSRIAKG
jgi:hypothetical protein